MNHKVAMAQGKQRIYFSVFPDQENREFSYNTGNNFETQQNKFDCIYECKKFVSLYISKCKKNISENFSLALFSINLTFQSIITSTFTHVDSSSVLVYYIYYKCQPNLSKKFLI